MSSSDSTPVSTQELISALRGTSLFATLSGEALESIAPIMNVVRFDDQEWIFAEGHLGSSLFVVHEGEVAVVSGGTRLATFRRGEFFGELALLDSEPRSATAIAQGSVVAFRLDQVDFYDVMRKNVEVFHNIMRVLCERLRRQNQVQAAS